jgi:hypothetical protein
MAIIWLIKAKIKGKNTLGKGRESRKELKEKLHVPLLIHFFHVR